MTTPPVPALRVEGLQVRFGGGPGLEPISFDVAAGERLAVVGASGAGKTTLLRAIAGLHPTAGGRVVVRGIDVTDCRPEQRDVVYLHQTPLLFPHLSVAGNVAFPLRVRRVPKAERQMRVAAALGAVQLASLAERLPHQLSGGQRHRAALARALVARPAVLLLDEPLASLDPSLRDDVREAIIALQAEYGPALVVVTHDLDDAGLLGDRIGLLLDRRLAQLASPRHLFAHPASLAVARFLGIPNEVPGVVAADGRFTSTFGSWPLDGNAPVAGPAVAVFRPEAVQLAGSSGIEGRVVALRHRAHRTTAVVAVGETQVEVALPPFAAVDPGTLVRLVVDYRQITVFSGRA